MTGWQEALGGGNKELYEMGGKGQEAAGCDCGLQLRGAEAGKKDFGVSAQRW